ncbi:hypothetical protein [Streptomyces hygroscopicus]|uniref:hypothetical protein n=1 Tax=Streptomyces hygroscopicus TaxID=1912 RepID=UPI00224022C0|nr:hypothetical protein [Streptomyces hygroscopicus]
MSRETISSISPADGTCISKEFSTGVNLFHPPFSQISRVWTAAMVCLTSLVEQPALRKIRHVFAPKSAVSGVMTLLRAMFEQPDAEATERQLDQVIDTSTSDALPPPTTWRPSAAICRPSPRSHLRC